MELTNYDPSSRIERFQALEPGMYWRTKSDIEDQAIPDGTVLLLSSIDFFEDKPHTIVLDGHPLLHPGSTFHFLMNDFLNKFEPALDAEAVRAREIATLQAEIVRIQSELMEGQVNPALMGPYVTEEVAKWEKKNNIDTAVAVPALAQGQQQSMSTSVAAAIGRRLTIEDAKAMQVFTERQAVVAKAQADWIEARTTAIAQTFAKMSPFFQEKASVALAKTKHIRDYAASIMKGLESMDLYIGKGVEVVTIVTGKSAGADRKLTLFQRKLFMDEELAAWAEAGDQFDFNSIEEFDQHIAANPSLRDQIFPEPRAVVSMAVRRSNIAYNHMDSYEAARCNLANKSVFLMVRNGENIYRIYSAQPTHESTPRLFPTRDDLNNLFKGLDGSDITFNDLQFTHKAAQSANISLHYKRFLILLCGLDHRLQLFGSFYDPTEYGKFISLEFQAEHFQFVTDDETGFMLGEDKMPVLEWFKDRNRFLQSGSRVLCYYPTLITPETAPACEKWNYSGNRDYIDTLAEPLVEAELQTAYRDAKEFCIDVRVKRNSWRKVVFEQFNARVSLTMDKSLSFLCLDAVKASDLEFYIYNRESRIQHIQFIRLFKEAVEILRAEAESEVGARDYIRESVAAAGFAGAANLDELIDASVRTWRTANRGKLLPTAAFKEELHPLLDHIYSLCRTNELVSRAEAFAATSGLSLLKLVMTGRNKLVMFVEVPVEQRDTRLGDWHWVRKLTLSVLKTKLSITNESLSWLTDKPNASEIELKTYSGLNHWINTQQEFCKAADLTRHCDTVERSLRYIRSDADNYLASSDPRDIGIPDELFNRLIRQFKDIIDTSKKLVNQAYVIVPIASYVETPRNGAPYIKTVIVYEHAATWLWNFGNNAQREQVRKLFVEAFKNKQHATQQMRSPIEYKLSTMNGPLTHTIDLVGNRMDFQPPEGVMEAWRHGKETAKHSNGWLSSHTEYTARSLNHFMEKWVSGNKFAAFATTHRILFGCDAWDGRRSHLEKYLAAGICLAKRDN